MQPSETNLHTADENHELDEKGLTDGSSKSKLNIIIMAVGGVVILGLLIALIIVAVKNKDKDDDDKENGATNSDTNSGTTTSEDYVEPELFDWSEEYRKAKELIKDYTLEEKMALIYSLENMQGTCVGSISPNKGFPGMCLQDGPAGVRFSPETTSWQASINTAATFNRTLMYEVGAAQGKEFYDKGITIMLAPCVNFLRNPTGGRVWEGFGEDPFLTSEAGVQIIKGIQSQNVLACIKHFIGNEIEDPRHNSSSNIPEEALWEIYLEPFYKAVKKADVASVMESYNAVNDTFMTRNKRLLQEILKDKIGFKGFIMSDWWSVNNDHYEHFANGCDMNMPGGPKWTPNPTGLEGSDWYQIPQWIKAGYFTEARVDDAATRIVASMYRLGKIPDTITEENSYPKNVNLEYNTKTEANLELNRQAGRESIVLLKNNNNFLPIRNNKFHNHNFQKIAIIGNNAEYSNCATGNDVTCAPDNGSQDVRYYTGYTALGWGSGTTYIKDHYCPLDAIKVTVGNIGGITTTESTGTTGDFFAGQDIEEVRSNLNDVCGTSDLALIFIGANSGEEYLIVENNVGDRNNLDPWHKGTELVEQVLLDCPNPKKVLIVLGPATVNINKWIHNDNIEAILFGGMLGGRGGLAIVDILFGDFSPSGHLPYVWAPEESYPNVTKNYTLKEEERSEPYCVREYTYNENLYIGQRYVDKYKKPYDYPFGYGLSYSTFEYSDLNVKMEITGLTVEFKVKNTGKYEASVVPMVFLTFPIQNYPLKVFKGFDKKLLAIDEQASFTIVVEPHDLSYYDVSKASFVRPKTGNYIVYVSENARDDHLMTIVSAAY